MKINDWGNTMHDDRIVFTGERRLWKIWGNMMHDYAVNRLWDKIVFTGERSILDRFWFLFLHTDKPVDSSQAWQQCSFCAEMFWLSSK